MSGGLAYAVNIGHFPVTVDGERADPAPSADRIRAQRDPHLPHPRSTFPQRPTTTYRCHGRR